MHIYFTNNGFRFDLDYACAQDLCVIKRLGQVYDNLTPGTIMQQCYQVGTFKNHEHTSYQLFVSK